MLRDGTAPPLTSQRAAHPSPPALDHPKNQHGPPGRLPGHGFGYGRAKRDSEVVWHPACEFADPEELRQQREHDGPHPSSRAAVCLKMPAASATWRPVGKGSTTKGTVRAMGIWMGPSSLAAHTLLHVIRRSANS